MRSNYRDVTITIAIGVGAAMALALAGCVSPPSGRDLTGALSQLKDDHATVCISVQSMYGTITMVRVGQDGTTAKGNCEISQGTGPTTTIITVPTGGHAEILRGPAS